MSINGTHNDAPTANSTAASKQPLTTKDELASLSARATSDYAHRRYTSAAESYSQAVELQAEMNGEMATENADLLYAYGRCLYKAAVEKSDVLGGKVGEASKAEASDAGKKRKAEDDEGPSRKKAKKEESAQDTGNLQFEGDDEEWSDESDEEAEGAPPAEDEEDDDFAIAYEILELARVLFEKKLQAVTADDSAEDGSAAIARSLKESLADIHDLQGEIHLENEQFRLAVDDERASLRYKEELHAFESNLIAEAHFKLSLSLEFASKTPKVEPDTAPETDASSSYKAQEDTKPDAKGMEEAAMHMEEAIKSTKMRLEKEEALMGTMEASSAEVAEKKRQAEDTKEMIAEMEERLQDLRAPPESLTGPTAPNGDMAALIGSLMGNAGAGQSEELKKQLAEASAGANDLTGLVKKKVKKSETAKDTSAAAAGAKANVDSKKPKVEDVKD